MVKDILTPPYHLPLCSHLKMVAGGSTQKDSLSVFSVKGKIWGHVYDIILHLAKNKFKHLCMFIEKHGEWYRRLYSMLL